MVGSIMERVERLNTDRSWGEISIALLDDEGIRAVNAAHLDRPLPTDVISFAYPPDALESHWRGEIVINVQRAIEEGALREGEAKEVALYIAHGCDHLSGADDATDEERRRMRRRELRWLRDLDYSNLLGSEYRTQ